MTSQQYADAMLAAWHERRSRIARALDGIMTTRAMILADERFIEKARILSREYEAGVSNASPLPPA
jgi:hypothetical protein